MFSKSLVLQIGVIVFSVFIVPRLAGPLQPPSTYAESQSMDRPPSSAVSRVVVGPRIAHLNEEEKEIASALPKVEILYNSNIDQISHPTDKAKSALIAATTSFKHKVHSAAFNAVKNRRRLADYTWIVNGLLFVIPCCFYLFNREVDSFRFLNISRAVSWTWLLSLCWIVSLLFLLLKCDLWENIPPAVWIAPAAIWTGGTALAWSIQKGVTGMEIKAPPVKPIHGFARQTFEKVKKEIFHMLRA